MTKIVWLISNNKKNALYLSALSHPAMWNLDPSQALQFGHVTDAQKILDLMSKTTLGLDANFKSAVPVQYYG